MSGDRRGEKGETEDLYGALGVPAGASTDDITRAYRRLAREQHPDANPDAPSDAFADLTDAYDVLRDPGRRRAYDNTRRARAKAATTAGVRIPVTQRRSPRSREPAATGARPPMELVLTFDQAALGTTVEVPVHGETTCASCSGRGSIPGSDACPGCGGAGAAVRNSGGITIRSSCRQCDGTGRPPPAPCRSCGGTGRTSTPRTMEVRIPAGVDDGDTVHLPADGSDDAATLGVVRVEPHPYFGRRGDDVTLQLPITMAEAALGAVVTVPTLTGAVAIRVPAGTRHGKTLRIRGRGIPVAGGAGDLLATVYIVIPTAVTDAQRVALEAFAAATDSPRRHFES
jgi:molecular chaperone DnaJ